MNRRDRERTPAPAAEGAVATQGPAAHGAEMAYSTRPQPPRHVRVVGPGSVWAGGRLHAPGAVLPLDDEDVASLGPAVAPAR